MRVCLMMLVSATEAMVNEELDRENPLFDRRIPVEVRRPECQERKEVRRSIRNESFSSS
jgi:hypothetical protein